MTDSDNANNDETGAEEANVEKSNDAEKALDLNELESSEESVTPSRKRTSKASLEGSGIEVSFCANSTCQKLSMLIPL